MKKITECHMQVPHAAAELARRATEKGKAGTIARASTAEKLMRPPKRIPSRCVIGMKQEILALDFSHWWASTLFDVLHAADTGGFSRKCDMRKKQRHNARQRGTSSKLRYHSSWRCGAHRGSALEKQVHEKSDKSRGVHCRHSTGPQLIYEKHHRRHPAGRCRTK
jgi:hypothetical protein